MPIKIINGQKYFHGQWKCDWPLVCTEILLKVLLEVLLMLGCYLISCNNLI